ncbi:MAG: dihydroorotase [Methanomassiliicoccales archaeon PtaB.Bin215]|nr:MAG: dihydroorotase [Methanomassiliicoccales archaeon PtaB.Bin215]
MDVVEGKLFYQGRLQKACVGIEEGRIVSVRKVLRGDEHFDFGDRLVLPGAVDPHVHFRDPGLTAKEDFSSGSLSALHGGVTCVLDMPNTVPPVIDLSALKEKREAVSGRSWVDYGIIAGIAHKIFLGSSTQSVLLREERDLARALDAVGKTGRPVSVHAEEDAMLLRREERSLRDHEECRPRQAELAAIERLKRFKDRARMNVCHVSCPESLSSLRGCGLTFEATPHHMLLDSSMDLGAWGKVNPPLRRRADREALFHSFCRGEVPMLATDHAPHTHEEKERGFGEAPSGLPGVETGFTMMLALVKRGFLSLDVLLRSACYNPAMTFGLNKGEIAEGRDADLVVIDPREITIIKGRDMHSKCGWTPYEGREALFPQAVFLRGKLTLKDGSTMSERKGREVSYA